MSRGLVCDRCGTTLVLNDRGEAETGEDAAWLRIEVGQLKFDACTRTCAHELLDDPAVVEAIEAWQEVIADIVNTIQAERDRDDPEEGQ